ncbi:DUF6528 family protein [Amycolatopsis anabasis]|uniref:DUF6528 family protein n=1 Tax=Amycolatopsis anabasis TaxID=1840409 RepID=UPI00131C8DF7|nr:DUF6528 family protein [Amycolatopsis anabasis]
MRRFRRLTTLAFVLLAGLLTPVTAAEAHGDPGSIAITEQASRRILVLPATRAAWTGAKPSWAWAPSATNGLGDLARAWTNPDEAKLATRDGRKYLLTTASGGFAAVVPYPEGNTAYWAADVEARNNPHSIELLPDGNVAVAASTGGWVRIYTASQGARSTTFAEFPLTGAHGVVWDAERNVLWVLGTHELVALKVTGTAAAPKLTAVRTFALPTEGGHDLQPVPGRADLLWLTTETRVYQFGKDSGQFSRRYRGSGEIDRPDVKSVTTSPATGRVLTASVQPGHVCTWCTDTVDLALPHGKLTLRGAWIYKARWWPGA